MTKRSRTALSFPSVKRRKVEADFCGGDITSHGGGAPFLSPVDQQLGLTSAIAKALTDPRRQASSAHPTLALVRQRPCALALGYEDLNDHQEWRHDPALQTAASRMEALASPSTRCRFEQRFDRQAAVALHHVLLAQFTNPDIARVGSRWRIDRSSDGFHALPEIFDGFLPHSGASRAFQAQLPPYPHGLSTCRGSTA